jgi:hypothetical protein
MERPVSTATPTAHHRPSSISNPGARWFIAALLAIAMAVAAAFVVVELDDSNSEPAPRRVEQSDRVADHLNDLPSRFSDERATVNPLAAGDAAVARYFERLGRECRTAGDDRPLVDIGRACMLEGR